MKILLTGASGFIGRHAIRHLVGDGRDLHTVDIRALPPDIQGSTHHISDLLDPRQTKALLADLRPTHLLHLAWYVTPGKYWTSPDNLRWMQASLDLIAAFLDNGGERSVLAGTCAEYDWSGDGILREEETPIRPTSLYGASKAALQLMHASLAAQAGSSAAWGRVFYLYGPHEADSRLVPYVIRSLLAGEPANCGSGRQVRDFLHVDDVAAAFARLLFDGMVGPVNIGAGRGVAIADVARQIADIIGRPELLRLGARPDAANDPPLLVADDSRLRSLSYSPVFTLSGGLQDTVRWWSNR